MTPAEEAALHRLRARTFETITRVVAVGCDTIVCPPAGGDECDALVVNGAAVDEQYLDAARLEPFDRTVVDDGRVFVLGDNRGNAVDSRVFGPVSTQDVTGVAVQILAADGTARPVPGAPARAGSDGEIADPPEPVPPAPAVER